MLDKISDSDYKEFLQNFVLLNGIINSTLSLSQETRDFNRQQFDKIDFALQVAKPLIRVQPTLVTIGYLRINFPIRHHLAHWQPFLEATEIAFAEKFKPEKVVELLRGLREIS